jgi:hypothetical protein
MDVVLQFLPEQAWGWLALRISVRRIRTPAVLK